MSYEKHFPVPPNTDEKHTNYVDGQTVLTAAHMEAIRNAIQADETYLAETVDPAVEVASKADEGVDSLDERINVLHELVNYGYNKPWSETGSASMGSATWDITRTGTTIKINSFASAQHNTPVKMYLTGDYKQFTGSTTTPTASLTLSVGHKYRLYTKFIGASSTTGTPNIFAGWYQPNSTQRSGGDIIALPNGDKYTDLTYTSDFENGICVGLALSRTSGACSVTDYTVIITVEDITDAVEPVSYLPQTLTNEQKIQARENIGAAGEDDIADLYMEPWQLMAKKYFITEALTPFSIFRNHIVYKPTSGATQSYVRSIVGECSSAQSTLADYTPAIDQLIPVSVFGDGIKMAFYVDGPTTNRLPRFAYKFCTIDGETVNPITNMQGSVPAAATNNALSEMATVVPAGATHVFFGLLFSDGYVSGTYDMAYSVCAVHANGFGSSDFDVAVNGLFDYGAIDKEQVLTSNGVTVTVRPNYVKLNGTGTGAYGKHWRLYSTITAYNGGAKSEYHISSGAVLKAGHTYEVRARIIRGSISDNANLTFRLYKVGMSTDLLQSIPRNDTMNEKIYSVTVQTDTEVCLFVYYANKAASFTNCEIIYWIEDVTNGIRRLPPPTADGTYTLKVTVTSGVPTYSWVADSASLMSVSPMLTTPLNSEDTTEETPDEPTGEEER